MDEGREVIYAESQARPATPTRAAAFRARHPTLVQLVRFTAVGGLGTLLNAGIFLVLRTWWDTLPANLVALVASTVIATELNRHFTFSATRGTHHRWRAHVQNGGTVLFYAFYSSAVLLGLGLLVDDPSPWLESVAVAAASVFGGFLRFLVMRYWVFRD